MDEKTEHLIRAYKRLFVGEDAEKVLEDLRNFTWADIPIPKDVTNEIMRMQAGARNVYLRITNFVNYDFEKKRELPTKALTEFDAIKQNNIA